MLEPDNCLSCGARPKMGIGRHPRFSIKVGIVPEEGDPDLVAYYAHDENSARYLHRLLVSDVNNMVMSLEKWDGETWKEVLL